MNSTRTIWAVLSILVLACSSVCGAEPEPKVTLVPFDNTGIADWRYLNPRHAHPILKPLESPALPDAQAAPSQEPANRDPEKWIASISAVAKAAGKSLPPDAAQAIADVAREAREAILKTGSPDRGTNSPKEAIAAVNEAAAASIAELAKTVGWSEKIARPIRDIAKKAIDGILAV